MKRDRLRLERLAIVTASLLVAILSGILLSYNIAGDQYHYREFYKFASETDYVAAVRGAPLYIGSAEPIYPTIVWIASLIFDKDVFIALINGALAYSILALFRDFSIPLRVGLPIVFTNFYFIVLYTGAERLKFAVLFMALAVIFYRRSASKAASIFALVAALTHVQVLVILAGNILHSSSNVVAGGKVNIRNLLVTSLGVLLIFAAAFALQDYIQAKVSVYMERDKDPFGMLKLLALFSLTLLGSSQRLHIAFLFAPLFLFVPLVGAERLILISYFFYLLTYSDLRSPALRVVYYILMFYFSFKSIDYVSSLIRFGNGFFSE